MNWKPDIDIVMVLLRSKIYPSVSTLVIQEFVDMDLDFAHQLSIVSDAVKIDFYNLLPHQIEFLELIDGDSEYNINWYKSMEGKLACLIGL